MITWILGCFGLSCCILMLIGWYLVGRSMDKIARMEQQLAAERAARFAMDRELHDRIAQLGLKPPLAFSAN